MYDNTDEYIDATLEPGLYYIVINAYNYPSSYTLSLFSDEGYDQHEPNDTFETATPIGVGRYNGTIGNSEDNDYYKITVYGTEIFSISLFPPLDMDCDLVLCDNTYTIKYTSSTIGTNFDENISCTVEPGDYYIIVVPISGESTDNYTLDLYFGPPDPYEFNEYFDTAYPVGTGTYQGAIGYLGDNDYFKINVTQSGLLSLSLDVPDDIDCDLEFFGSNWGGDLITGSHQVGCGSDEYINWPVDPGEYYIRVSSFEGQSANYYTLNVSCGSDDVADPYEPNDTRSTATSINLFGQIV
jgi:hypothetical protein